MSPGQESQNVKMSHVKQVNRMSVDKHAIRASHWKEHGAIEVLLCSAVVGTVSKVLIRERGDWEEADCQDGGFRDFLIFLSFSCLTVSPSREDSSQMRWMKERGAPATGSG